VNGHWRVAGEHLSARRALIKKRTSTSAFFLNQASGSRQARAGRRAAATSGLSSLRDVVGRRVGPTTARRRFLSFSKNPLDDGREPQTTNEWADRRPSMFDGLEEGTRRGLLAQVAGVGPSGGEARFGVSNCRDHEKDRQGPWVQSVLGMFGSRRGRYDRSDPLSRSWRQGPPGRFGVSGEFNTGPGVRPC